MDSEIPTRRTDGTNRLESERNLRNGIVHNCERDVIALRCGTAPAPGVVRLKRQVGGGRLPRGYRDADTVVHVVAGRCRHCIGPRRYITNRVCSLGGRVHGGRRRRCAHARPGDLRTGARVGHCAAYCAGGRRLVRRGDRVIWTFRTLAGCEKY